MNLLKFEIKNKLILTQLLLFEIHSIYHKSISSYLVQLLIWPSSSLLLSSCSCGSGKLNVDPASEWSSKPLLRLSSSGTGTGTFASNKSNQPATARLLTSSLSRLSQMVYTTSKLENSSFLALRLVICALYLTFMWFHNYSTPIHWGL